MLANDPTIRYGTSSRSKASTVCRKISICSMSKQSPQELALLFFGRPIRIKLLDATYYHDAGTTMSGIGQGNSLRGGLGGQCRGLGTVDDFDARP